MKNILTVALLILARAAALPLPGQDSAPPPSWTSIDGKTIEGRFEKVDGHAVVILKEGTEFTIPFSRLTERSLAQARSFAGLPPSPPDKSAAGAPIGTRGPSVHEWHLKYSPETFSQLPAAQAKLDRAQIDTGLLSAAIAHATNEARLRHGAKALTYSPALQSCALGHSRDMAVMGFFSHENPKDPARRTMSQRLAAESIENVAAGENISRLVAADHTYHSYAKAVVAQWMKSPGHRANLLSAQYKFLGCAAHPCRCPQFHLIATQNFSSAVPASSSSSDSPAQTAVAQLNGRMVIAPDGVPPAVKLAIDAGNALQFKGYKYGGGRACLEDTGYDCSGAVSYVLIKAGLLDEPCTSRSLGAYGEPGPGRWITVSTAPGHAFITICGLRFDTGGRGGAGSSGPRWNPIPRGGPGWTLRHPPGL